MLFLVVRRKRTEVQRAQVICPVSHNSMKGPEIKHPAEKPPEKNFCRIQGFTHMNGRSKQNKTKQEKDVITWGMTC